MFKPCHPTCCALPSCSSPAPCCPLANYYDNFLQDCVQCHPSCTQCANSSDYCLACVSPVASYLRIDMLATNNSCPCQPGYTDDIYTKSPLCIPCHYSCVECSAPGANNCTVCTSDPNYNRTDLSDPVLGGTCPCLNNYAVDLNTSKAFCVPCHYSCKTCVYAGDEGCSSCENSSLTFRNDFSDLTGGGACQCMQGYYDDGVSNICLACHYTCLTCLGSNSS